MKNSDKVIGNNIKKYRKIKKLTQSQLANKIDKSLRMIQKYESGEVAPTFELLQQIANELGVGYRDLLPIDSYLHLGSNEQIEIKDHVKLTPDLMLEIIKTLDMENEVESLFLIDDDVEFITNCVKRYIIDLLNLVRHKNLQNIKQFASPSLEETKKFMENFCDYPE